MTSRSSSLLLALKLLFLCVISFHQCTLCTASTATDTATTVNNNAEDAPLERKRKVHLEGGDQMECSITATGEKDCTKIQGRANTAATTTNANASNASESTTTDAATAANSALEDEYDGNGDMYDDDEDMYDDDDDDDKECIDKHEHCSFWASLDECTKNPTYMLSSCMKSCNNCNHNNNNNNGLLLNAEIQKQKQQDEKTMLLSQVQQYGVAQQVITSSTTTATPQQQEQDEKTFLTIRKTVDYMKNYVYAEENGIQKTHVLNQETMDACRNNEALCSFWASLGECEANPAYMVTKCAPACLSCHKIDYSMRCGQRDPNSVPGLKPGEMNLMFQRIVDTAPGNVTDATQLAAQEGRLQDDGTPIYTVTVHSRPETPTPTPDEDNDNAIILDKEKDAKESPWVITLDNFLTDQECQHLIDMGHRNGYERSTDVGHQQVDGSYSVLKSRSRTSENSWCNEKSGCRGDPMVSTIMERLGNVTGIPPNHYEDLQLLKYEVGQFYKAHHDFIGHQVDRHSGPRILTFFLYLSDVEEGGGTLLNDLGIEIKPKMGRALLWPSAMSYDPSEKDPRTRHEALVVEGGLKFAANAWIHLYDNVEATKQGCT